MYIYNIYLSYTIYYFVVFSAKVYALKNSVSDPDPRIRFVEKRIRFLLRIRTKIIRIQTCFSTFFSSYYPKNFLHKY